MKLITAFVLVAALMVPASSVTAAGIKTSEDSEVNSVPVVVKSLTDYPGRVRTVTETQKDNRIDLNYYLKCLEKPGSISSSPSYNPNFQIFHA